MDFSHTFNYTLPEPNHINILAILGKYIIILLFCTHHKLILIRRLLKSKSTPFLRNLPYISSIRTYLYNYTKALCLCDYFGLFDTTIIRGSLLLRRALCLYEWLFAFPGGSLHLRQGLFVIAPYLLYREESLQPPVISIVKFIIWENSHLLVKSFF